MVVDRRKDVLEQYRDSSNLAARVDLHARYSTNPKPFHGFAFERLEAVARRRVLEVGCGPGWLWRLNSDRIPDRWRILATDLSFGMVSEAREHLTPGRLFQLSVADSMALPVADSSFDTVVANHMLYHVPDLDAAMRELARVLENGGVLIAATNGERHFEQVRAFLPPASKWAEHIRAFGLETGPPVVARYFADVIVERHPSTIEVRDAEPVLRYIASSLAYLGMTDVELARVGEQIDSVIARHGVFRITADAGIITARKT